MISSFAVALGFGPLMLVGAYVVQSGVNIGGATVLALPPTLLVNGAVVNSGWNFGGQTGVYIR